MKFTLSKVSILVTTTAKVPFDHFVESQIITLSKVLDHFFKNHFVENMIKSQKLIQNTFDMVIFKNSNKRKEEHLEGTYCRLKHRLEGYSTLWNALLWAYLFYKTQIKADHDHHNTDKNFKIGSKLRFRY